MAHVAPLPLVTVSPLVLRSLIVSVFVMVYLLIPPIVLLSSPLIRPFNVPLYARPVSGVLIPPGLTALFPVAVVLKPVPVPALAPQLLN
jgi:hypothetical protein